MAAPSRTATNADEDAPERSSGENTCGGSERNTTTPRRGTLASSGAQERSDAEGRARDARIKCMVVSKPTHTRSQFSPPASTWRSTSTSSQLFLRSSCRYWCCSVSAHATAGMHGPRVAAFPQVPGASPLLGTSSTCRRSSHGLRTATCA